MMHVITCIVRVVDVPFNISSDGGLFLYHELCCFFCLIHAGFLHLGQRLSFIYT
uniref:Uncharacterized protein n=1 Tax=Octopus bimaculoides TaxID=37653 RepID=A0A0L8GGQ2_OCTBM